MLLEPIEGTFLSLGRTPDYGIRISKLSMTKEYQELGVVGYQILNTSTGVIEAEGTQLYQALLATKHLQENLDEAKTPTKTSPSDIFNS